MFGLSKLADRNFVIGFVLPILLAYIAGAGLYSDYLPSKEFLSKIAEDKSFASLTVVVLAVWTSATVLMAVNRILYRLLEGYFGPLAQKDWQQSARENRDEYLEYLKKKYAECKFESDTPAGEETIEARRIYASARAKFLLEFPMRSLVMPTKFGNVIRAFENYPNEVYKIDGISGWSRLIGVLPASYTSIINDAHAEVDFWVNCCCLAAALTVAAAVRVVFDLIVFLFGGPKFEIVDFWYAVYAVAALYISNLAYLCATERAIDWGNSVKSAFDLYLPNLAKQLGYELPTSRGGNLGQDEFWDSFSSMFLLHTPIRSEEWKALPSTESKTSDAKPDVEAKEKPADEAEGSEKEEILATDEQQDQQDQQLTFLLDSESEVGKCTDITSSAD